MIRDEICRSIETCKKDPSNSCILYSYMLEQWLNEVDELLKDKERVDKTEQAILEGGHIEGAICREYKLSDGTTGRYIDGKLTQKPEDIVDEYHLWFGPGPHPGPYATFREMADDIK